MADLQCDPGLAVGVHEIDNAFPGIALRVVPDAGASGRDARIGRDAGHFGNDQSRPAHAAAAVMHQMKVAGQALLRRIGAHRCDHDAIDQAQLAQREGREHRRHRIGASRCQAAGSGEPAVDAGNVGRVAQLQVGMTDALAAAEQRKGKLLGLQMYVAFDVLEPDHAIARRALQLERLDFPLGLIAGQRSRHIASTAAEHLRQRDRVFHRQLGAGADRKMRGMRGIADQHDVVLEPALAQHAVEFQPDRRAAQMAGIGDQRLAVEQIGKQLLAKGDRLIGLHLVDAGLEPGLFRGLDDEGRPFLVEAIGMQVEPAPLRLLE